jgi:hypothetical protein
MTDPKSPVDHAESGEYPSACIDVVARHEDDDPSIALSEGPASCAPPRWPAERPQCTVAEERQRVKLIGDLSKLLHDPCVPEAAKNAGLTLIGWLARRQPGEAAHAYGVESAQRARSRRGGR